jgi:hypothetical protein
VGARGPGRRGASGRGLRLDPGAHGAPDAPAGAVRAARLRRPCPDRVSRQRLLLRADLPVQPALPGAAWVVRAARGPGVPAYDGGDPGRQPGQRPGQRGDRRVGHDPRRPGRDGRRLRRAAVGRPGHRLPGPAGAAAPARRRARAARPADDRPRAVQRRTVPLRCRRRRADRLQAGGQPARRRPLRCPGREPLLPRPAHRFVDQPRGPRRQRAGVPAAQAVTAWRRRFVPGRAASRRGGPR